MNERIRELAKQAGFLDSDHTGVWVTDGYWDEEFKRFAELVAAAERLKCSEDYLNDCASAVEAARLEEREACAQLCEDINKTFGVGFIVVDHCAAAIRARGEK